MRGRRSARFWALFIAVVAIAVQAAVGETVRDAMFAGGLNIHIGTAGASGFPDASNTGVPTGTSLTTVADMHITTNNQIVDAVETGLIVIDASNVTIKNSYIHGQTPIVINSGTGLTVQDSTLDCEHNGVAAIEFSDYTALRVESTGCENGFRAGDNVTIQDSYIHDLDNGVGQHNDGIDSDGPSSNVIIDHNTILARDTSAIIMYTPTDAANTDWTITNNYLDNPDNIDLYCPRIATTGIVVTGNHMVLPTGGSARYTDDCSLSGNHVNTWSGNVDAVSNATIPPD